MESVGQKLREARLRLGLTLEQVSAETRITLKNLRALEADDVSGISSPFFYRSFVRQFAQKVKLDYASIAGSVQETASTMPEPLMPGQEEPPAIRVPAIKPKRHWNMRWLKSVLSFCLVAAACTGVYTVWQNPHTDWQLILTQVKSGVETLPNRFLAQAPSAPSNARSTKVAVAQPPMGQPAEFHVQLSAVERTWLSVVSDGKQTFSGVLDPSQTKVFEGRKSARVHTGNVGGLTFVFNGKQIGVLGPRGQVRTVVFTKTNYEVLQPPTPIALTAFIPTVE